MDRLLMDRLLMDQLSVDRLSVNGANVLSSALFLARRSGCYLLPCFSREGPANGANVLSSALLLARRSGCERLGWNRFALDGKARSPMGRLWFASMAALVETSIPSSLHAIDLGIK